MKRLFYCILFLSTRCLALYPKDSNVVELNSNNFDKKVLSSDSVWMVEFYAPWCGHCQKLVPEYTKTAKILKGIAKIGAINVEEHKNLASKYNVHGFPTLKIFGADKNSPEEFNGERTSQKMVESVLDAIRRKIDGNFGRNNPKKSVVELTDKNFDKLVVESKDIWLVEFFAPWCKHCQKFAPEYEKVALELKGKIKVGAMDVTKNTQKTQFYNINKYPTVKLFFGSKTNLEYSGTKTKHDIVQWALEQLFQNLSPPEVSQVNKNIFKNTTPISVIAILPQLLDCQSKCRNSYIDILKTLAQKYKNNLWSWFWCEGGAQKGLEIALDIGGFGYPAMAVVNSKKMKFSLLRGPFSQDGIDEFLKGISYGKGDSASIKGDVLPEIVETGLWDGKDGVLPVEEDSSDIVSGVKDEL